MPKFVKCNVLMVYTDRKCFDALAIDGMNFFENISYTKLGTGQSGEDGIPQINELLVIKVEDDGSAEMLKRYPLRQLGENGLPFFQTGEDSMRGPGLPGDYNLYGPDGSALSLLCGIVANVRATPLCQILFLGIENLTRLITKNQETITAGTRYTTISDNGKVQTRFVISSDDINFVNSEDGQTSERYEFQFQMDEDGLAIIFGEIDPTTKKRKNHLVLNANFNNDITLKLGSDLSNNKQNVEYYLSYDGSFSHKMFDENGNTLYNKTITTAGSRCLVNEYIKGSFTQNIIGDLVRNVSGNIIETTDSKYETVNALHQQNSAMHSVNASIHEDVLNVNPQVSVQ